MRYKLSTGFLFLATIYCFRVNAQQNGKIEKNANNVYLEKIVRLCSSIPDYDYRPIFQLRFAGTACSYEILINDFPAYYSFSPGNSTGEQVVDIGASILHSGKQQIKIKIFPETQQDHTQASLLADNTSLRVRIVQGLYGNSAPEAFKEIFSISTPRFDKKTAYFEMGGFFKADVPYILKGWSDGIGLLEEDSISLKEEVLKLTQSIRSLYENKNLEGIAKIQYQRVLEYNTSHYYTTDADCERWINYTKRTLGKIEKMVPLEKYKLAFYAKGKIVTLIRTDPDFLHESPIMAIRKDGLAIYPYFFYRPRAGAPLKVVR